MLRVFISQPMRGKTDSEIKQARDEAISWIQQHISEDQEFEVVGGIYDPLPKEGHPLRILGNAIKLLSTADIAYFVYGWEDARGCRIEHQCAIEYGISEVIEDKGKEVVIRVNTNKLNL